jgi:sec-independent protein translocase protein TatA
VGIALAGLTALQALDRAAFAPWAYALVPVAGAAAALVAELLLRAGSRLDVRLAPALAQALRAYPMGGPQPRSLAHRPGRRVAPFGAGRLADIGKGLGEGIKNFKKGLNDDPHDDADKKDPKPALAAKDAAVSDPIDEESKKRA